MLQRVRGGVARTKRLPATPAPPPLEAYAIRFDELLESRTQREGFRRYLEVLLRPAEHNKTLTTLANTEPVAGVQRMETQSLQRFLPESCWDVQEINERRLELLFGQPETTTAPEEDVVLVIDDHGDRK
jgi:SRSO17 transposase